MSGDGSPRTDAGLPPAGKPGVRGIAPGVRGPRPRARPSRVAALRSEAGAGAEPGTEAAKSTRGPDPSVSPLPLSRPRCAIAREGDRRREPELGGEWAGLGPRRPLDASRPPCGFREAPALRCGDAAAPPPAAPVVAFGSGPCGPSPSRATWASVPGLRDALRREASRRFGEGPGPSRRRLRAVDGGSLPPIRPAGNPGYPQPPPGAGRRLWTRGGRSRAGGAPSRPPGGWRGRAVAGMS